ncbi:hypothetical protein BC937DRAFT_88554 [Endogone sp. FLAS-F59071]|nr:hypothetical protein BC937DRAFT_88554 [Endogone sp. FLAS-F59071]|eukprot:RUS18605.1 hypothetical protein BC937DRAFT_88554 [Endogone sp. FLAS-F59071]
MKTNSHETEFFDHVIVTCPLGVVRRWDLPDDVAELALRDIVKIHGKVAREEYLDCYVVHYWSTDPIAGGGTFTLFEPGQFNHWLPGIKTPEHHIHSIPIFIALGLSTPSPL